MAEAGGRLILQGPGRPTGILTALEDMALADTGDLRIAVAYTTLGGCHALIPRLKARIGEASWDAIPKVVITSRDFGLTEPAAIEYLRSGGIDVRFSTVPPSFHPKLYSFRSSAGLEVLVGSANLTRAALTTNTEAATVLVLTGEQPEFEAAWDQLLGSSTPVDDELLAAYAAGWSKAPPAVPPDPQPPTAPSASVQPPTFSAAVTSGAVDPAACEAFWIEAGTLSGGSRTQLELPREAHRFFGFAIAGYDDAHRTLGFPPLASAGRAWTDRPLTWHGNNRMERINLPSRDNGGFEYVQTAILFRRLGSGFQLTVAGMQSDVAESWRAASRALGQEYRLGTRGTRRCGLF